ncbi:MAG: glycosyltransferase [Candidatus Bathyarchaeia archaeon]|jgi:UDP-N-acetylglucosamine:LPS N-acetylglucosamine transferase
MTGNSILFLSWQGGLGHITRDLAIVKELHRQNPKIRVSWMAHPLASQLIQQAGETLLPESELGADYNLVGAQIINNFKLDLVKYSKLGRTPQNRNIDLFRQVIAKYDFDLVIGDESYEIAKALFKGQIQLKPRMVMIEDFVGAEAMTGNPLEKIGVYQRNRFFAKDLHRIPASRLTHFFVGELEDIPDKRFGFFLPNRREFARQRYQFLGYIIRFNPAEYTDKAKIRKKLGYGTQPLVICATGGTCAGKEMLETCGKAYTILKKDMPDLHMVFVCGELFGLKPPELPPGAEVHVFIPDIYEHYAACDMAVVVGGGTTTVELTALRRPFVFFPLENQYDQQLYVAERLARQGAGIKMRYFETTPESLANTIRTNIGKEVDWKPISVDGAQKAARLINGFLTSTTY